MAPGPEDVEIPQDVEIRYKEITATGYSGALPQQQFK
jgi:hypothetical protein